MKFFTRLGLMILLVIAGNQTARACHAIALVNFNQQTINATSITVNAASDSPTCGCAVYWLDLEVRCVGQAFDGAPFSPGFWGPLGTYPYFQSAQMNKPNCVVQNYPGITIPFAGLCPGTTYQYRMRENHNGQAGPWCATQTFTAPGVLTPFSGNITSTGNNICAGNCVTLTANTTGGCHLAVLYSWSNGATTQSITVCPATTTTYTCTMTDDCTNLTSAPTFTVNVVPNPVAGTANVAPSSICAGDVVNLSLTGSQGGIQWQTAPGAGGPWSNIGGATTANFTTGPQATAACFRAEVTGCGAPVYSNVVCITINPPPTVTIPAVNTCAGSPATLTPNVNPAGGSYSWNTGAITPTLTDAPAVTTTYTLTYTVAGCSTVVNGTINVNPIPTVNVNTVNICNGNPGTLTATPDIGGGTYLWSTGATTQSITDTPPISTTYTVTYSLNGCTATGSGMINIGVNPLPTFTAPPNCLGNAINFFDNTPGNITGWLWDFGDGNTSTLQNPTHLYATGGTFNVSLTAYDGPCQGTTVIPVTIFEMPVPSFTITPDCATQTTFFNSTSTIGSGTISVYDWTITGGSPASANSQNATTVYPSGGTYTVQLYIESNNGCADSITQTIVIPDMPIPDFSFVEECLGNPTCFTDLSTVNGSTINQWNWNFGDGNTSTTQNPCNNYAIDGTYNVSLTVTTNDGCTSQISQVVNAFLSPTAAFTTSPVCLGVATQFNNTSIGAANSTWDFGDGNTSTLTSPTHTYATAGTYVVTLTVATGTCSDVTTQNITVNPLPVANFSVTPACPNLPSAFTDLSTVSSGTITGWAWSIPSALPATSTSQNPNASLPSGGAYSADLIVTTNNGCVDTITVSYNIPYTPIADYNYTPVCQGNQTCFTDLSTVTNSTITGWSWDFGDGSPLNTTSAPCYTYASSGTFPSTLVVTSADGCVSNLIPHNVDVFTVPVASFTVADVCQEFAATFNNTSNGAANYDWDFGDGNTDNNFNTTHQYNLPGTYNVTLIISSGFGCADTITNPITIFPMPTAGFNFTNVCLGNAINFTDISTVLTGNITNWNWDFGDTQTSTNQNPSNTYATDGSFNVNLVVTTDNGCVDDISQSVTVFPLPVVNFSATAVCLNASTTFTNNSTINSGTIANYTWDFGDGTGTSTQTNPTYVYTANGTFIVDLVATSDNGCVTNDTVSVTVHPNPVIDFIGDDLAGCNTHCVNFTNNTTIASGAIASWIWDFGDGNTSNAMNPTNCYFNSDLNTQTYSVQLVAQSDNGCDAAVTINNYITVYPDVIAAFTFGPQPTTILNNTIQFTNLTINGVSYTWDFGDGNNSTGINPSNTYGDIGTYPVELVATSSYGCVDTSLQYVEIGPDFILYVPNTFTPDGDGINDIFFPVIEGHDPLKFTLQIFDRWGDLFFESSFPGVGWDGTYKSMPAKDDTYVWRIVVKDIVYGKQREFVGHVNLLR